MVKILSILCAMMAIVLYAMTLWIGSINEDRTRLKKENAALQTEIERFLQNDLEKNERKKRANELVQIEKNNFDWHRDISDSVVINELRRTCKSCAKAN